MGGLTGRCGDKCSAAQIASGHGLRVGSLRPYGSAWLIVCSMDPNAGAGIQGRELQDPECFAFFAAKP